MIVMPKTWYHISNKYLGENVIFEPKTPMRRYKNEGNIPHICVTDSIFKCLRSIYGDEELTVSNFIWILTRSKKLKNVKVKNLAIYKTEDRPYTPPSVRDFELNNEKWFIHPTRFIFCGYLDSKRFIYNDEIALTGEMKMDLSLELEQEKGFDYCFDEEKIKTRI